MKLFKNILESLKPPFEKGGKFEKLWPLFDGFETFLFVPGHSTKKGAHIRDGIDLKRTMITVVLALVPCLLFGMWNVGFQHYSAVGEDAQFLDMFLYGALKVLPLIIVSYGVGLGIEFVFCIKNGHAIQEGFLVSGILIPLIMPVEVPLWMVAVATAFAVVFGKEVFGGTGMNILNPALTARAFLFFAYPTKMSGDKVWVALDGMKTVDGYSGATALGNAVAQGVKGIPSLMDSMIGWIPGSVGETSVIAIVIGAGILIYSGIGSWRIMLSMLIGGYVMGMIFNLLGVNNAYMQIPAVHQLMLGGFFFGMVFMATDPVSASQTVTGKWIYGFFCGVLGILIRVVNPAYPEGIMMAILFMNVMAPLIDHYVVEGNIKKRLKRIKASA
jgi:Na+-transporting NADH:ubiquinone oxidoreductase subunit B|tara:strand:+ start:2037 stop:3194 length:1158 start_codon:yes stop_codon:yes gene_type:complete